MTTKLTQHFSTQKTPQSEPIPGKQMVQNSAGGFGFAIDDWARLDRFLILGTEGGTYYATEHKLTRENAQVVERLLALDGVRLVNHLVEVSEQGRAPKNDYAIFALALCLKLGDVKTRQAAVHAVPKICRIGTHIFQLAESVKAFGGWGETTARAFGNWYGSQHAERLAMNVVKYRDRHGWTHRDLLRKSHVRLRTPTAQWVARGGNLDAYTVLRYKPGSSIPDCKAALEHYKQTGELTGAALRVDSYPAMDRDGLPEVILGYEEMKKATSEQEVVRLIEKYDLPREVVEALDTKYLNSKEVWNALLHAGHGMPFTAMIRNLGKMTSIGLIAPLSEGSKFIRSRLEDVEGLKKARVHPITILMAMSVYGSGHGVKGSLSWTPDQKIVDALDDAFYASFGFVEPTGLNWLLGIDVSGSMDGGSVAGTPLTPREAAGAMAMVTARTEKEHFFGGFTSGSPGEFYPGQAGRGRVRGFNGYGFMPLEISPKWRLDQVVSYMQRLPMGGTDCALPILYALAKKIPVHVFATYTDNESWAGEIHVSQALQMYRREMGIPAKLIAVGLTATEYSIADPNDAGMMDVVGFDTAAPQIMADFAKR